MTEEKIALHLKELKKSIEEILKSGIARQIKHQEFRRRIARSRKLYYPENQQSLELPLVAAENPLSRKIHWQLRQQQVRQLKREKETVGHQTTTDLRAQYALSAIKNLFPLPNVQIQIILSSRQLNRKNHCNNL